MTIDFYNRTMQVFGYSEAYMLFPRTGLFYKPFFA